MNVVSVSCNHCGASLEFPEKTKFVTCNYCKSKLKVEASGSAFYTEEILEEVREVADDVETIKLQNRLERLDREWQMGCKKYMIRTKDGHEVLPQEVSKTATTAGMCFVIGFVVFWIIVASFIASMFAANVPFGGLAFLFPLFGVAMICMIIFGTKHGAKKLAQYQEAESRYNQERQKIVQELNKR